MNAIFLSIRSFFSEVILFGVSIFITGFFLFFLMAVALFSFVYLGYQSYTYLQDIHHYLSITSCFILFALFIFVSQIIYNSCFWTIDKITNWFD